LGIERVLIKRGIKKISVRIAKKTAESGATEVPLKRFAKSGKLVKGKHINSKAQQTSVKDCQNLGFIGFLAAIWDFVE